MGIIRMDPECVRVCDAMNLIEGIETTESCCGHGDTPFRIWFDVKDIRALYPIVRSIDPRYSGRWMERWSCEVVSTDIPNNAVVFALRGEVGSDTYDEANHIADFITEFLDGPFVEMFNVRRKSS